MNFLGGGERHCSADYRASRSRSADSDNASPGDLSFLGVGRPGDVRFFIHKSFVGKFVGGFASKVIGGVPLVGGLASSVFDRLRGAGASTVPAMTGCPPGFILTAQGCQPRFGTGFAAPELAPVSRFQEAGRPADGRFPPPTRAQADIRMREGLAVDPAAGVPVMGRFGAGTEPEIFMTDTRRCPRRSVLGVDGICYNKGDLKNADRWWPRGRRPLLTGGEMRAISTASSAAKKLQRKQKQLESLGLLKRPAPRTRRALPAGHRAELRHVGSGHE